MYGGATESEVRDALSSEVVELIRVQGLHEEVEVGGKTYSMSNWNPLLVAVACR